MPRHAAGCLIQADASGCLVVPGGACRREVERDALVRGEPVLDVGRRVRRRVVQNDVVRDTWECPVDPLHERKKIGSRLAVGALAHDALGCDQVRRTPLTGPTRTPVTLAARHPPVFQLAASTL